MSAPTAEQLTRITAAREADLIRSFAFGRRLEPREMAELQHVLPLAVLTNPPSASIDYLHPYAHYAQQLGCDVRQIKRYVHVGRAAQPQADFPPFDKPADFPTWWRRHHKGQPSREIFAFGSLGKPADPISSSTGGAPSSLPPAGASSDASAPKSPLAFEYAGIGGFEESVRELRVTVAAAQLRLKRAMAATPLDESLLDSCNKAVGKQLDLLRKTENDLFEFQQKRGDLVPRADIREDWRTLLSALRMMRRRMAGNAADELLKSGQFTPEQIVLVKSAIENERAREDQLLRGSQFWRQSIAHDSAEPSAA